MNKKLFLGMGTIASVVAPVVAVVSCGSDKATNVGTSTEAKEVQVGTYGQLPGVAVSGTFEAPTGIPQTRTELAKEFEHLVFELAAWETNFEQKGTPQHDSIVNASRNAVAFQMRLQKSEFIKLSKEDKVALADQIREFQQHVKDLKAQLSYETN